MLNILKSLARKLALAVTLGLGLTATVSAVELTMYYPVAVGGALTKIVDGLVEDFMKENPDIKVNAIYAGNYNDARIKALAALKSGKPAQTSVMFSIDIYELIEQGAIVAFDDVVARRLIGIRRRPRWRRSSPPTPPRARARTSRSTPASRRPPRATVSRGGPGVCAGISTAGAVRRRDDARRGRRRRERGAGPPAATPPAMDPPRRRLDAPDDAWILPPRPGTTPSRPPPRPMGRAPRGIAPPPGCTHP